MILAVWHWWIKNVIHVKQNTCISNDTKTHFRLESEEMHTRNITKVSREIIEFEYSAMPMGYKQMQRSLVSK